MKDRESRRVEEVNVEEWETEWQTFLLKIALVLKVSISAYLLAPAMLPKESY